MDIKISLKQLIGLFAKSAGDEELAQPVRQLAARLTVLVAHIERVEAKVDAEAQARQVLDAKLDAQIAELAGFVIAVRESAPSAPAQAAPVDEAPIEDNGDDEDQALIDKAQRETEADMAAIASAPATITPLRKTNSGVKKAQNEEAS